MGLDMYLEAEASIPFADAVLDASLRAAVIGASRAVADSDDGKGWEREVHLARWDAERGGERASWPKSARLLADSLGLPPDDDNYGSIELRLDDETLIVETHCGYWRKENAIHAWFVREVQDGIDECQRTEVSRDQLAELRDVCLRVLGLSPLVAGIVKNGKTFKAEWGEWRTNLELGKVVVDTAAAEELLPTQGGFFFGSTDYDEWYIKGLRHTAEVCERALACPESVRFFYRASW